MAKQTSNLNLLVSLIEKKNITINTKSEKAAKSAFHKMYDCIHELGFMIPMFADNIHDYCFCGSEYGPTTYGPYEEVKKIVKLLNENNVLQTPHKSCLSVDSYKDNLSWYKNNMSEEEFKTVYPHYTIKIGGDRFGNNFLYSISWIPEEVTHTSKRDTESIHKEKVAEVCKKIGVLYNCPNNCWVFARYKKVTEYDYLTAISHCDSYINGTAELPLCSDKQATWVVNLLGTTIEKAKKLNKFQAGEILDYCFNSDGIYSEEGIQKVKDHYNNILKNM